jgi:hypothetical protein
MMKTKTMDEQCIDHARVAARHVKMKGLDRTKAGAAFMAEGLGLIFGIDAELAGFLAKVCGEHVTEQLIKRRLERGRRDGATEKEIALFKKAVAEEMSREPFMCKRANGQ